MKKMSRFKELEVPEVQVIPSSDGTWLLVPCPEGADPVGVDVKAKLMNSAFAVGVVDDSGEFNVTVRWWNDEDGVGDGPSPFLTSPWRRSAACEATCAIS